MKKRLLKTLLVAAGLCAGSMSAWGDDNIFSYTLGKTTQDNFSTTTDDSWNDYEATGGTFSLYYKKNKSSVARDGEEYYYNFGGAAASIKLTLSSGTFQAGDVVSVTFKSNSGSKNASYHIRTAKESSTNQLTSDEVSSTKCTNSVTLDANFATLNSIFIERVSQGMYVYAVTVARPVTYNVSAITSTGDNTYGTVSAASTTLAEGKTTTITAVPASGYKVTNWAVSGTGASISPEGASNSTTTTLTMGSADATVTVTFGAAGGLNVTHTLTNVTASSGDTGENAVSEGSEYTAVFEANSGYVLPDAITVTIGGETATVGTEYTWDKSTGTVTIGAAYVTGAIVITVTGEAAYTLTYEANGGTGTMENTVSKGSITLAANTYTKTGYTFMGWATSQTLADAGTVAYANSASYTLSADATLYAVWVENDYSFAPTLSSGSLSSGDVVATSTGGKMVYTPADGGSPTLKYSTTSGSNCIEFGGGSQCQVTVTLDKVMQPGTVITLNYYIGSTPPRGFYLANYAGTNKATFSPSVVGTYTSTYTVEAGDGLSGSNKFIIKRYNNAYLNTVTVVNCKQVVPATIGSTGYTTFASSYALDLTSLPAGLTAYYVASNAIEANTVTLTEKSNEAVAAGTGLILAGEASTTYEIPVAASGTDISASNLLVGCIIETSDVSGADKYVLVKNSSTEEAEFQSLSEHSATIPAGKAYLDSGTSEAGALKIVFADQETTGIETVQVSEPEANGYYNLAGQRVAKATKGLYIVNGKKVIMK